MLTEYRKEYGRGHKVHRVVTSAYWLCQVLYISVHRCDCWQVCITFCVVFSFLFSDFKCIKKGYYILKFFIGVRNRDIMTKKLSLICLFFVLICLSISFAWDNLSHVNPMLPFKQGLFCLGKF
jgi:hypothetical protein